MPLRSVRMKRFIFGFQRRVWCPKWTPLSSSCFMLTTAMAAASLCSARPRGATLLGCRGRRVALRPGVRAATTPRTGTGVATVPLLPAGRGRAKSTRRRRVATPSIRAVAGGPPQRPGPSTDLGRSGPSGAPRAHARAAGEGVVVFAGMVAGRPVVSVDHAGGLRTTYEPVDTVVGAGQPVARGAVLGTLAGGHAGCPVAACLHWGLRRGEVYLDPLSLLGAPEVRLLP